MNKRFALVSLFFIAASGCSLLHSAAPGVNETVDSPGQDAPRSVSGSHRSGKEVLHDLCASSLRLTTSDNSVSAHFQFRSRITTHTAEGIERIANVLVVRDDTQVAILCTSDSGLPYYYATRGFCMSLDPLWAGGLVAFRGGSPSFRLSVASETNRLVYDFSYFGHQVDPSIDFDLSALLQSVENNLRSATFDEAHHAVEAHTNSADVVIALSDTKGTKHRFPVAEFRMTSTRTGNSVMITNITTNAPPPFNMAAITDVTIRRLNLPIRSLVPGDEEAIGGTVPPDFGKNPAERHAAEELRKLIDPSFPASSPKTDI